MLKKLRHYFRLTYSRFRKTLCNKLNIASKTDIDKLNDTIKDMEKALRNNIYGNMVSVASRVGNTESDVYAIRREIQKLNDKINNIHDKLQNQINELMEINKDNTESN